MMMAAVVIRAFAVLLVVVGMEVVVEVVVAVGVTIVPLLVDRPRP